MARQLDPKIAAVLKEHGFGPDACWDSHGVWVVYHRILEQIAATSGIRFDQPQIVEADGANGIAAVCVTGTLRDRSEWSIGEASPKNNKNAYCWAMAEKRGKDRVILKLIGLHGLAYSEHEADDFKPGPKETPTPSGERFGGPLTITELKKTLRALAGQLAECKTMDDVAALETGYADVIGQCIRDLPDWYYGSEQNPRGLQQAIEDRRDQVNQTEGDF